MNAQVIIACAYGLIQITATIVRMIDRQKLIDSGKAEAMAECLAAINRKVMEAKRVETDVERMSDDDIARELSNYSYRR